MNNEKIHTFGKDGNFVGLLTEPASKSAKPAVILMNAGIVHHVGPYRSSVDLARKLAVDGFSVFRFDLGGLGDSEMRRDNRSDEERFIADTQDAMNYLETQGVANRFILIGLCSGADNAHPVAVRDPRVVGGVFLDGFGYETAGFRVHHYWARISDPMRWRNVVRRTLNGVWSLLKRFAGASPASRPLGKLLKEKTYVREFPPRARMEQEVQALADRGMELLYIYTSGVARYLNYKGQFKAMFPKLRWKPNLQLEFYPAADHTYSLLADRKWLFDTITAWMRRFG